MGPNWLGTTTWKLSTNPRNFPKRSTPPSIAHYFFEGFGMGVVYGWCWENPRNVAYRWESHRNGVACRAPGRPPKSKYKIKHIKSNANAWKRAYQKNTGGGIDQIPPGKYQTPVKIRIFGPPKSGYLLRYRICHIIWEGCDIRRVLSLGNLWSGFLNKIYFPWKSGPSYLVVKIEPTRGGRNFFLGGVYLSLLERTLEVLCSWGLSYRNLLGATYRWNSANAIWNRNDDGCKRGKRRKYRCMACDCCVCVIKFVVTAFKSEFNSTQKKSSKNERQMIKRNILQENETVSSPALCFSTSYFFQKNILNTQRSITNVKRAQ